MISLIVWGLTIYGITNIGVYGSVLNRFRDFIERIGNGKIFIISPTFHFIREMMRCIMCLSTWIGFLFGIFLYSPIYHFLDVSPYISWFFDGALASGIAWIINSIVEWFEENRPKDDNILN